MTNPRMSVVSEHPSHGYAECVAVSAQLLGVSLAGPCTYEYASQRSTEIDEFGCGRAAEHDPSVLAFVTPIDVLVEEEGTRPALEEVSNKGVGAQSRCLAEVKNER